MPTSSQAPGIQDVVLSISAATTYLKFSVHPWHTPAGDGPVTAGQVVLSGIVTGLETGRQDAASAPPMISVQQADGSRSSDALSAACAASEHPVELALRTVIDLIETRCHTRLRAIAHRVAHGGNRYGNSVTLDEAALTYLGSLKSLAPQHQPYQLMAMQACLAALPAVPQIACFDTAFHATLPEAEQRFALPESLFELGVRRYGFHGLSYRHMTQVLQGLTPAASGSVLLGHLGLGASLCAVREGASVATTSGFSAFDGLIMGTRSGSLDAGVVLHLLQQGWKPEAIEKLLYRQSGLLGVSGLSSDLRILRDSQDPQARRAIGQFTHRVIREAGALTAVMGGLDLIAFSGMLGQQDPELRAQVTQALGFLGVQLDQQANAAAWGDAPCPIHAPGSRVEVWVIPGDAGRVAAQDAIALLG